MNTAFPHSYTWEELAEGPGSGSLHHYYYPGASMKGGRDGILIEVRPEFSRPWLGTFAFGEITPKGVSGVFTMPNPHQLCVVARGAGYVVAADDPTSWQPVRASPIIDVRPIPAHDIIVFAEYIRLIAYGRAGIRWETKRLSWDSLRITEVSDACIKGEFWDIRCESMETFSVDLTTGMHQGGIQEPL